MKKYIWFRQERKYLDQWYIVDEGMNDGATKNEWKVIQFVLLTGATEFYFIRNNVKVLMETKKRELTSKNEEETKIPYI